MNRIFILVWSFCVAACGAERIGATSVQHAIEVLLASQKCPVKDIGVEVKDLHGDSTLVSINADSMLNPASVSKLVTAAAAFEKLGPAHCFTTRIFADTIIPCDSGIAVRTLYIQGGGDPGFTAERLWLFVEHLSHLGIREISGNLVLDDSFFDSLAVGPGFDEDSTSYPYQPLISALAMNFNTVAIHSRPGLKAKLPIAVNLFPEIAGVKVAALATTAAAGKKDKLDIFTVADSGTTLVRVQGTMGLGEPATYTYRKLWQTWESFGGALQPLFARRGIALKGSIVHGSVPGRLAGGEPFYEFPSEPIAQSVNRMFKYSSNFTAEMLFKTLSAQRDTAGGSWEKSAALVTGWWKEHKLSGVPLIKNGSGMGNANRISPAQIVDLLSHVWKQKSYLPEYLDALPNAGFDGTLKSRFAKSKLKGLVRAKTGTLNSYGISTLAGYILLPGSEPFAFAIFCHKTGRGQWEDWMLQEQILEKIGEMAKNTKG